MVAATQEAVAAPAIVVAEMHTSVAMVHELIALFIGAKSTDGLVNPVGPVFLVNP